MNIILATLAVLLIIAALAGELLKSAAAVAYQRLKTLRLPRLPHWSGKVTINLWQAGLLTVALALLFWSGAGRGCAGPLPDLPSIPWVHPKADAVVYIYEKDQTSVPSPVAVALDKLNRQGVTATTHEVDSTDGTGDVPEQYKLAVAAAKTTGLPALVVSGGGKVIRTLKDPRTEASVMEAAK